MSQVDHYAIRGGHEGRERLRVLARVMRPGTTALLDRFEWRDGLVCLDAGCGGGDVTLELARRVAPSGRAIGFDLDETKLAIARDEAERLGVANVAFEHADVRELSASSGFDFAYCRFVLSHLREPAAVVRAFHDLLRPGGHVVVEDIDASAAFVYPELPAYRRYDELYNATVRRRGGDPNIGPRLPSVLMAAGFQRVGVHIVQPSGLEGEVKRLHALTLENIAPAVEQDGLATADEIQRLVRELYACADDPTTLSATPRIVQAWGVRV